MYRPDPKNVKLPKLKLEIERVFGSYAEFGRYTGCTRSYVQKIIAGERSINERFVVRLIRALEDKMKKKKKEENEDYY